MLTLYLSPGSSAMATHIALHEIGVPFEARPLSFAKGEQHAPEYLAINPEGKVPTLLIDGLQADRGRGHPLLSGQALSRGRAVAAGRPRRGGAGDLVDVVHRRDRASGAPHRPRTLEEVFKIADPRLGANEWTVGGHYSIADIHLFRLYWRFKTSTSPGARRIPEPRRPFRADHGPPGGPEDNRDRECDRLQPAVATGVCRRRIPADLTRSSLRSQMRTLAGKACRAKPPSPGQASVP